MTQSRRVAYIDLYRGMAILLMVMGHVDFGKGFDHYIHAFHMPMWFFVSGYFFQDKGLSFRQFVKQKAKKLLVPYAFFGLFHYGLAVLLMDRSHGLIHGVYIRNYLFTNHDGLPITGVFWFLSCLLIADVIFLFMRRRIRSDLFFGSGLFGLSLLGILYSFYSPVRMPWSADTALVSLFFYHLGYLVRHSRPASRGYEILLAKGPVFHTILFAANLALIFLTPYINMRTATYAHPIPFYWNAATAILVYLNACHRFSQSRQPLFRPIQKWLCYVGENSMTYLCLNQLTLLVLQKGLPHGNPAEKALVLAVCMAVLTGIARFFQLKPLAFLVGKPTGSQR